MVYKRKCPKYKIALNCIFADTNSNQRLIKGLRVHRDYERIEGALKDKFSQTKGTI